MTNYNIGYYNKEWNKTDFVIMAQTKNKDIAECIMKSYNRGYEENGLSCRLTIVLDSELPTDFRFMTDNY